MAFDRFVVDSSIFIAFYWSKDTQHKAALRMMEELASSSFVVHPYVIQEVATVLMRKLGTVAAKRFLADVSGASNVNIPWVDVKADISAFNAITEPLSFTDIALVRLAKADNAELLTFDRKMLSIFKGS